MVKRRKYTNAFKQEVVDQVRRSGRPQNEVASELGIPNQTLSKWLMIAGTDSPSLTFDERAELQRLRKELASVKEERDFLKKVSAYFAKDEK